MYTISGEIIMYYIDVCKNLLKVSESTFIHFIIDCIHHTHEDYINAVVNTYIRELDGSIVAIGQYFFDDTPDEFHISHDVS